MAKSYGLKPGTSPPLSDTIYGIPVRHFVSQAIAPLGTPKKARMISGEAFNTLTQSLTKAIETLTGLLDHQDDRLKRLTAKDIIDFIIRHKENEDLDKRLTEVEKRIEGKS